MFKRTINWIQDHYHLLFKSAADNHLRIQNILKNSDGTYQLTVKFSSYTELKKYQQKVRRLTVSLSSAIAMVVVAFIISPYILHPNKSAASTFLWTQNNWKATGNNSATIADKSSPSNFDDYAAKQNVTVGNGSVTMTAPNVATTGDSVYTAAPAGFYLSGNQLALQKVSGASCSANGECKSGACSTTCLGSNGDSCTSNANCSSNICYNNHICGEAWIDSTCGVQAYYSIRSGGYWSTLYSYCAGLSGRIPTQAEMNCVKNMSQLYIAAGRYAISGTNNYLWLNINGENGQTVHNDPTTNSGNVVCVK